MGEDEVRRRSRAMADGLAAANTVPGATPADTTRERVRGLIEDAAGGGVYLERIVDAVMPLAAIVRKLAENEIAPMDREGYCQFCDAQDAGNTEAHDPECPWRRAVEWTRTQETT